MRANQLLHPLPWLRNSGIWRNSVEFLIYVHLFRFNCTFYYVGLLMWFLWFSWFSWWGGEGNISRNKKKQTSGKLIGSSHSSISYETIQLQGNLKSGKFTSGIVLVTLLQQNENLPWKCNLFSHTICHFGSGDLPIHVNIWSFLQKSCSDNINK